MKSSLLQKLINCTKTLLLSSMLLPSCNDSNFSSKTPELSKTHEIVDLNTEGASKPYDLKIGDKDELEVYLKKFGTKSIGGEDIINLQPVDMIIALDVTASMTDEIEEVKNSVLEVVDSLKKENIDLSVGMVTFVDTRLDPWLSPQYDQMITKLTSDTNYFVNKLENLSLAEPNKDFPEAGLWAIQHSIEILQKESREDAMKVVLALTDAQLHNGETEGSFTDSDTPVRDCSIQNTVSSFDSYASSLGGEDKIKFFYAAPTSVTSRYNTCSDGQLNPRSQLEAIFSSILPSIEKAKKGGHLKDSKGRELWPVTGGELSKSLISMIKSTTTRPTTELRCYVESAVLSQGNNVIEKFAANTPANIGADNSETFLFSPAIELGNLIKDQNSLKLELAVERCCIKQDEEDFKSCKKKSSQIIPIQITKD